LAGESCPNSRLIRKNLWDGSVKEIKMNLEQLIKHIKKQKYDKIFLSHEEINSLIEEEIDPNLIRWTSNH